MPTITVAGTLRQSRSNDDCSAGEFMKCQYDASICAKSPPISKELIAAIIRGQMSRPKIRKSSQKTEDNKSVFEETDMLFGSQAGKRAANRNVPFTITQQAKDKGQSLQLSFSKERKKCNADSEILKKLPTLSVPFQNDKSFWPDKTTTLQKRFQSQPVGHLK